MPKGDKKRKTKQRKITTNTFGSNSKELILKAELEEYALVTKLCGDCKVMVQMPDSTVVMGRIPGKWRKKIIVKIGSIVLISKREYQDSMVDIIYQYTPNEIRELQNTGEIPLTFVGEVEDKESGIVMVEEMEKQREKDRENGKEDSDASLSDL